MYWYHSEWDKKSFQAPLTVADGYFHTLTLSYTSMFGDFRHSNPIVSKLSIYVF